MDDMVWLVVDFYLSSIVVADNPIKTSYSSYSRLAIICVPTTALRTSQTPNKLQYNETLVLSH
jgi:hypothetical protein